MAANSAPARKTVQLQVGDQTFTVKPETLSSESHFFQSLFSSRWSQADDDGAYRVDCDPAIFKHILDYCQTHLFPLCVDDKYNHDLLQYRKILVAAEFFGFDTLAGWIKQKKYESALVVTYERQFWPGGTGSLSGSGIKDVVFRDVEQKYQEFFCITRDPKHATLADCEASRPCNSAWMTNSYTRKEDCYKLKTRYGVLVQFKKVDIRHEMLLA